MNRPEEKGTRPGGAPRGSRRRDWLVPSLLLLHAAIPALGGAFRVLQLTAGGTPSPANQRFFDAPAPMLLHGVACVLFAGTGAFQFTSPGRRSTRRHRIRGAVFVPSALIVAGSGLWMEATYPLPEHDGALLALLRVAFGAGMVATTLLGLRAALRRRFAEHGAWMARTYAIGMGAGTQVFVLAPWALVVGAPGTTARALLMGAAWFMNLALAEWYVRRRAATRAAAGQGAAGTSGASGAVAA